MVKDSKTSQISQLEWFEKRQAAFKWRKVIKKIKAPKKKQIISDNELEISEVGSNQDHDDPEQCQRIRFPFEIDPNSTTDEQWMVRLEQVLENLKTKMEVEVVKTLVVRPKKKFDPFEFKSPRPINTRTLLDMMYELKPGTFRHRLVRNCLIVHLTVEENRHAGMVAEIVGLSESRVKIILKEFRSEGISIESIEALNKKLGLDIHKKTVILNILERQNAAPTTKSIQDELLQKHRIEMGRGAITKIMKEAGYQWKPLRFIQSYVNTQVNIIKRCVFAKSLIRCLEQGFNVINIDESNFNSSFNQKMGWVQKGNVRRSMAKQTFENITLIAAIAMDGSSYYEFVKNSNTQYTYAIFMEDLSAKLDKEDPGWRGHTVMVMDNATPHTGADIQKVISDLKLPVFYTSPASFNALPVELWFSIVKRKFNVTHKEAMEKHAKEKEEGRETKLVDLRVRAIDSAIQMTPRTLTKKCFIRQLSKLSQFITKQKM